ncbi:MAG: hypothetical protein WD492_00190 [Alkalispirochaeta sp.]
MIHKMAAVITLLSLCVLSAQAQRHPSEVDSPRQLVLATADTPPYSSEDGSGIYDRLLRRAFDRIDVSLTIRHLPSERALLEADQGRVDGEFARTEQVAQGYSNLVRVPAPLSTWDFVAVARERAFRGEADDTGPNQGS